ncbi:MAG TPA: ABC transporter permease [Dongiaceae bacterium]|nr:ABC transporter permease [Dongiaceae bacterium]
MRSLRLIGRRLLQAVPVLLLVIIGIYLLLANAPGDAVDAYLAANGGGDAALAQQLRQDWSLAGPVGGRLLLYLDHLLHLDLGYSVAFNRPVLSVIADRVVNTLLLTGCGLLLAATFGVLLGILAASRPGSWRDFASTALSLTLNAMPGFWLALLAIIFFAVKLAWFPLGGIESFVPKAGIAHILDVAWHLVLPVMTLAFTYLAIYQRLMRVSMLRALASDYIRVAKAKGLPSSQIVWKHAFRNAILPVITMLGVQAGSILGGSVVIESVFAIPGLGRLAYEAVVKRDTPLLVGVLLCGAILVILANLLIDLLYSRLDPRIEA